METAKKMNAVPALKPEAVEILGDLAATMATLETRLDSAYASRRRFDTVRPD